ncbi:MAG: 30S ribosomal protein S6--L-glutamate ligase [Micavibrio aeruginosavorus]|uniref:30S ribosomal protein S6--L-glutamate ligase n=1 Tax=Micavibrio aeruginosavorus TaxID=349221 RepID=A0A2W5Q8H1_9BACT|nr:MAG: 30S ribosomal protein S6--L-glutamate ligase [Micavibrio aeruginosavorus]
MEVWILYGDDIESASDLAHEVRRFKAEAERMGVDLKVYNPAHFDLIVSEHTRDSIMIKGKPVKIPDVVYPYFNHHDHSYFSLAIVRQLERMGCLVYNTAETIETVRDKLHTHQVLCEKGITSPTTMLAKFPIDDDMMNMIEHTLGFPLIVKTLKGALGVGVFLIENAKSFRDQMDLIGQTSPDIQLIFQEFVEASKGRDLRLFVVDGEVIASMERRAKDGDFKANFSGGGSVHEFKPDQKAIDLSVATARVLNIEIGGIDLLFLKDGGYTICEANTFPGFKGLEKASGVNVPEKIFQSMERRLVVHQKNKKAAPTNLAVYRKKKAPMDIINDWATQAKRWFADRKVA